MYSPDNKGFTLIELLVVVVLLGIVTSFAVLAMGTGSSERKLEEEAKRLHALIKLVQEEAIIQSKEIAMEVDGQKYTFLEYQDKKWIPMTSRIFRARTLKSEFELKVDTEAESKLFKTEKNELLRLYFLSSGEQTPFEIRINLVNKPQSYFKLAAFFNGKLSLEKISENEI